MPGTIPNSVATLTGIDRMNTSPDTGSKVYTLTNSRTTSARVIFNGRGGTLFLGANSAITSLTFHKALAASGGLISPLLTRDSPPVQVAITGISVGANGAAIDLPPEVFGGPYIIMQTDAADELAAIALCG